MLGELFTPVETPEAPNRGFFKGLFGGGAQSLDREELCKLVDIPVRQKCSYKIFVKIMLFYIHCNKRHKITFHSVLNQENNFFRQPKSA
jgi:hypothetical protein